MAPSPTPARCMALAPMVSGAALVALLLLFASPSPASAQADFCATLVNITQQCANPSTEDAVNLALFAGKWYLTAATSGFAFLPYTILGGQCATVQYTSIGRQFLRKAISVVNKNLRLLDDNQRGQVGAISQATQALGMGLEQLCGAISGPAAIAAQLQKVTQAGGTSAAGAQAIQTGIAAASSRAAALNDILAAIQQLNNLLNGVGLPLPIQFGQIQEQLLALLSQIDSFIALFTQQQMSVRDGAASIKSSTSNFAAKAAANSILSIAGKAGSWSKAISGMTAARDVLKKVGASLGAKNGKTGVVSAIILSNNSANPLDSVAKLKKAFSSKKISKGSSKIKNKSPLGVLQNVGGKLLSILKGTALQDPKKNGKFNIDLGALRNVPYSIVKLTGKASAGYSSALIYLCAKDPSTGNRPLSNLLVLSRAPSDATNEIIKEAISAAQGLGIFLPGANPLLQITQNPTLCSILQPLE